MSSWSTEVRLIHQKLLNLFLWRKVLRNFSGIMLCKECRLTEVLSAWGLQRILNCKIMPKFLARMISECKTTHDLQFHCYEWILQEEWSEAVIMIYVLHMKFRNLIKISWHRQGFSKGQAPGKLTGCERDLAINFPGCFRLLFLLSFIRKAKKCPAEKPYWPPAQKLNETPASRFKFEKLLEKVTPCKTRIRMFTCVLESQFCKVYTDKRLSLNILCVVFPLCKKKVFFHSFSCKWCS